MTIDDFNNYGFKYGDSVDVKFSNGYELLDSPYYNGYYVDMNEPLLIGYPGYDYIKAAVNYGNDLWITANLKDTDTATISLNKRAKYLKIQNSRDIHYAEEQGNIPDIVFANFRNVKVGND